MFGIFVGKASFVECRAGVHFHTRNWKEKWWEIFRLIFQGNFWENSFALWVYSRTTLDYKFVKKIFDLKQFLFSWMNFGNFLFEECLIAKFPNVVVDDLFSDYFTWKIIEENPR